MPANRLRRCYGCLVECSAHYCEECKEKNLFGLDGEGPVLKKGRFSNRVCGRCTQTYTPTGACSHFCELCLRPSELERMRRNAKILHENGPGSGSQQNAERNHQWKGGTSRFQKKKLESLNGEYFCERCSKDLRPYIKKPGGRGYWAVHHKDENHYNTSLNNLELLCKRCHQQVHECWKHLPLKV